MSTHEITEADVVVWVAARAREAHKEFGGAYGTFQVRAFVQTSSDYEEVALTLGAQNLAKYYEGTSSAEAFAKARAESKPDVAREKREMAARLLAEAEALEGKS